MKVIGKWIIFRTSEQKAKPGVATIRLRKTEGRRAVKRRLADKAI